MKTALFTNFTNEEFIGWWNGKQRKYESGKSEYMPDHLAKHFAKHLVNKELLRTDRSGALIYKDGEKMTSPKKPEEVPLFMELFNKAYTPDDADELGDKKDDMDTLIDVANKNKQEGSGDTVKKEKQDPTKPQVVLPPDFEDDADEESSFGDKPVDSDSTSGAIADSTKK